MDDRNIAMLRKRERAIRNDAQLAILRTSGDDPSVPREVDHFARFHSRFSRWRFRVWLAINGYNVAHIRTDAADMPRFVITFVKVHAVDEGTLPSLTDLLTQKIESLNGVYEGWGCQPNGVSQ